MSRVYTVTQSSECLLTMMDSMRSEVAGDIAEIGPYAFYPSPDIVPAGIQV